MRPIDYTPQAAQHLAALPEKERDRLMRRLKEYASNRHAGVVKKLKGESTIRIRSGNYRILFEDDGSSILVVAAGHRKEIYR